MGDNLHRLLIKIVTIEFMKKLIIPILLLAVTVSSAQKMTCCTASASASGMRAMADDPDFVATHEAPIPFNYSDQAGKMITFSTPDGKMGSAYEVLSSAPTNNFLIITHEWWGLNDYIKQRADELQKTLGNINIIAVDMYDGKVASTPDSAGKYMKAATNDRIMSILNGAIAFAGPNARIFSLGWCFGGGYAMQTAILAGKQGAGCVMYYGMPETDITKLKSLNCDVLGLFGNQDKWINPDMVKTFQSNMEKAGKKLTVKEYNADHAFANPSNAHFDKASAEDANKMAIEYIKKRL